MRCAAFVFVCLAVATLDSRPAAQGAQPPAQGAQTRPPAAARVTIAVFVTSMDGKPLARGLGQGIRPCRS